MTRYWIVAITLCLALLQATARATTSIPMSVNARLTYVSSIVLGVITEKGQTGRTFWVKIRVHDTLLGPRQEQILAECAPDHRGGLDPPEWAEPRQSEQLFLLSSSGAKWITGEPLDLGSLGPESSFISDDLQQLQSREEVLEELRKGIAQHTASPRQLVYLNLPKTESQRLKCHSTIVVLGTDHAIAAAHQWIRGPEPRMRGCGAMVLSSFKSPENVDALRRFARGEFGEVQDADSERVEALRALRDWGEGDLPPLVYSSRTWDSLFSFSALVSVAMLLGMPVLYWRWAGRLVRYRTVAALVLLNAVLLLAIRSYGLRDAFTWGDVDLAFAEGYLYMVHHPRTASGLPCPPQLCRPEDLLMSYSTDFLAFPPMPGWPGASWIEYQSFPQRHERWLAKPLSVPLASVWRLVGTAEGVRVSVWLLVALTGVPMVGRWLWQRYWTARKRGFPVEVQGGTQGGS